MFAVLPYFGRTGSKVIVTPVPPSVLADSDLSERTVTVTASATGVPTPTLSIAMTSNGVTVTPTLVSAGVWTWVEPSSEATQRVEWTVTATSSAGTDAVAGAENIAPDLVTPTVLTAVATSDGEVEGTVTGIFSVTVSNEDFAGTFAENLVEEFGGTVSGAPLLASDDFLLAPLGLVKPTIERTSGATDVVGSVYTATSGLWLYDAADTATDTTARQWFLNGVAIGGATGETYTTAAQGVLTCVETFTGAGATRTMRSNAITIGSGVTPTVTYTARTDGLFVEHNTGTLSYTARTDGLLVELV